MSLVSELLKAAGGNDLLSEVRSMADEDTTSPREKSVRNHVFIPYIQQDDLLAAPVSSLDVGDIPSGPVLFHKDQAARDAAIVAVDGPKHDGDIPLEDTPAVPKARPTGAVRTVVKKNLKYAILIALVAFLSNLAFEFGWLELGRAADGLGQFLIAIFPIYFFYTLFVAFRNSLVDLRKKNEWKELLDQSLGN